MSVYVKQDVESFRGFVNGSVEPFTKAVGDTEKNFFAFFFKTRVNKRKRERASKGAPVGAARPFLRRPLLLMDRKNRFILTSGAQFD